MAKDSQDTLVSEPPGERVQACVVVPVRNEEELLPSALRALAEQKTLTGTALSHELYEVILLINNTTDRSHDVARGFQRLCPTLRLHVAEKNFKKSDAHIGYVRRLLMDEASRRLRSLGRIDSPILSTDSDSQVAPNWIARNQEEFDKGAQAVGGRIVIPPCEQDLLDPATRDLHNYDHLYRRLVSWVEARFDPEPYDPWPRHHHHFGASLAVTPRVYEAVGRLPPRRYLEDVAFYNVLIRNDVRLRHSNKVKVFTSGRLSGRARFGLSRQLRDWQEWGKPGLRMPVETGRFLIYLFTARHRLRLLWSDYRDLRASSTSRIHDVAAEIGVKPFRLARELQSARHFGSLLEKLEFYETCRKRWPDWRRLGPLKYVLQEMHEAFKADHQHDLVALIRQYGNDPRESLKSNAMPATPKNVSAHHPLGADNSVPVIASELITGDRRIQLGL